jgi:hypothetical protein
MNFARSGSAALDPVLVPEGFAAGQCGDDQAIWCGGHDELSDRFPALPQSDAQVRGVGCCIDLVVAHVDDGLRVTLEGTSLTDTLRALQLDHEAAEVDRLEGAPLDVALPTLADILPRLFRAAAA